MKYIFRGKVIGSDQWVYGNLLQRVDSIGPLSLIEVQDKETLEIETFHVYPESVGMWTGRTDKKGIEIYDGDVLGQDCSMVDDYSGKHSIEVQRLIVRWDGERLQWTVFCPDAVLQNNWGYIPRNTYVLNPAVKDSVTNTMNNQLDPNAATQQAEGQETTNDQVQATEQEAQEKAMESEEEGTTEG
jgi:hypothetical protein